MKQWESEMYIASKTVAKNDNQDFLGLYMELKQIAKNSDMENGDIFMVETSDQSQLKFIYEDGELKMTSEDKENVEYLVSKQDSRDGEYKDLINFEMNKRETFGTIGAGYPQGFEEMIEALEKDDFVVFENGSAYLCTGRKDNDLYLKKVCGNKEKSSVQEDLLSKYHEFVINIKSSLELKEFYDEAKDYLTNTLNARMQKMDEIKREMDEYKKKRSEVVIGNHTLKGNKKLFGTGKYWNNEKDEKLSDEKVNISVAWMKNAPVAINFIRTEENKNQELQFCDMIVKSQLEYLLSQENFDIAYDLMKDYSIGSDEKLVIRMKTYQADGEMNFNETSIIFANDSVYLTEKGMNEDFLHIKELEKTDFETFGSEKFGENFISIRNQGMKELLEKYPQLVDEIFEKIAETADQVRINLNEKKKIEDTMEIIEKFESIDKEEDEVELLSFDELCERAIRKYEGRDIEDLELDMEENIEVEFK